MMSIKQEAMFRIARIREDHSSRYNRVGFLRLVVPFEIPLGCRDATV